MPGWYYTVESTSAKHLISQFKDAIQGALSSDSETRAKMRAVSAKQRFPVARWVEEISELHTTSIAKSEKHRNKPDHLRLAGLARPILSRATSPSPSEMHDARPATPTSFLSPSHPAIPSTARSTNAETGGWPLPPPISPDNRRFSGVSITSVTKGRKDFALQKVDPFFTDADGEYTEEFKRKLAQLDSRTSETDLCIEQYLVRSEKQWFEEYKSAKFGLSSSRNASKVSLSLAEPGPEPNTPRFLHVPSRPASPYTPSIVSSNYSIENGDGYVSGASGRFVSAFETDDNPNLNQATLVQKFMLRKVFDWPVYTLILAFGQILAANSYQISLLNGEQGQTAGMLYTIASIYAGTSVVWWIGFRRLKSVWVLSTPFAIYGLAFIFAGCAPFAASFETRGWVQKVASGLYAAASSSGSMFFALNFGDEGGAPVRTWVIRACAVQGIQQIYISALWYWGSLLSSYDSNGIPVARASGTVVSAVCLPVAALLIGLSVLTFLGLPNYYRQTPGSIPSFFKSIFRRKLIIVSPLFSPSATAREILTSYSVSSSRSSSKTTGSPRSTVAVGASSGPRRTPSHGRSSSSSSSSSAWSGPPSSASSPTSRASTAGCSPCWPSASARRAGRRSSGACRGSGPRSPGRRRPSAGRCWRAPCGSGSGCWTRCRAPGSA